MNEALYIIKVRMRSTVWEHSQSNLQDDHGCLCHGTPQVSNLINSHGGMGMCFFVGGEGHYSATYSCVYEQPPLIQNAPLPSYIKPLLLSLCTCVGCVAGCHDDRPPRCQPTWDWLCASSDWCSAAPGPAPLLSNDNLMEFYCRFFRL